MNKTDRVPIGLRHRPIVGIDDYSSYDGLYKDATDAKALSVGLAQWKYEEEDGVKEISAKVFRRKENRWSRQSEELPIHRCFDLCILIVQALQRSTKGEFFEVDQDNFVPYVVNENELEAINLFFKKYKDAYLLEKMENLKDLLERFLSQK